MTPDVGLVPVQACWSIWGFHVAAGRFAYLSEAEASPFLSTGRIRFVGDIRDHMTGRI